MSTTNYWRHRFYDTGQDGTLVCSAEYISHTSQAAVAADLKSAHSRLKKFIGKLFGSNAEEYARLHPLRAEALVGGQLACTDYMLRTGDWLPIEHPPTEHIQNPLDLGGPNRIDSGIALWFFEQPSQRYISSSPEARPQ